MRNGTRINKFEYAKSTLKNYGNNQLEMAAKSPRNRKNKWQGSEEYNDKSASKYVVSSIN